MDKEILDSPSIYKLLETFFTSLPVFVFKDNNAYPIQVLAFKQNYGLIVKPPDIDVDEKPQIFTITNSGSLFLGYFKVIEKNAADNIVLSPFKIVVKAISRNGEKVTFPDNSNVRSYVTNIINYNEVMKSLSTGADILKPIIKSNVIKIKSMFEVVDVYINERVDVRMRLMQTFDKPIFIPNIDSDFGGNSFVPYAEYYPLYRNIKEMERFKSEVCIPIKYRSHSMIGYLQVLHTSRLDMNSYNFVNLVASTLKNDIASSSIFSESKEQCVISDVSNDEISFMHPPSVLFTRMISLGAMLLVDLISDNDKITLRGTVVSIKPLEKSFRIGLKLKAISNEENRAKEDFFKRQRQLYIKKLLFN